MQGPAEVLQFYAEWAKDYEDSVDRFAKYLNPVRIADLVDANCKDTQPMILDAACGTGLVGSELSSRGKTNLYGVDISPDMLSYASAKGCYRDLTRANLYQPLPFPTAHFDIAVCAGAFCPGHLKARALKPLLDMLKPGGFLVCDVERHSWGRAGNMAAAFMSLVGNGALSQFWLKEAHFYAADPGEPPHGFYVVAWKA